MKFKQYLEEEQEAYNFIQCLVMSGGPSSSKCKLTTSARKYLKKTISGDLVLYRGIGLIKPRVDKSSFDELNNLKVGDEVPKSLMKKYGNFASYTKKKSLAKNTYSEGSLSIIIKSKVPSKNIIADLEKLRGDIWYDDLDYFKQDKEVIVEEPVTGVIEFTKGKI